MPDLELPSLDQELPELDDRKKCWEWSEDGIKRLEGVISEDQFEIIRLAAIGLGIYFEQTLRKVDGGTILYSMATRAGILAYRYLLQIFAGNYMMLKWMLLIYCM